MKRHTEIYCIKCDRQLAIVKSKVHTTSEHWVAFCKNCYDKLKVDGK